MKTIDEDTADGSTVLRDGQYKSIQMPSMRTETRAKSITKVSQSNSEDQQQCKHFLGVHTQVTK